MIRRFFVYLTPFLSVIFLPACYPVEENKSLAIQDDEIQRTITNLGYLNFDYNQIINDESLSLFIRGHRYLKVGNIDKADEIFRKLKANPNKKAKEYGEYGRLLLSVETENMLEMKKCLNNIQGLNKKSKWLEVEERNYTALYYYTIAEFDKAKNILNTIPESETSTSPFLASLKANLLIRENKLDTAKNILQNLNKDSESSIATLFHVLIIKDGPEKALDYLATKLEQYPNNELIKLLYNSYLMQSDRERASDNLFSLAMNTSNSYILINSMQALTYDVNQSSQDILDKLNILLNDRLNTSKNAKKYIDYYIFELDVPKAATNTSSNIEAANEFNPMNYSLLLHKFYQAEDNNKLEILHSLEKIDPYDNYTLLLLAQFYKYKSMQKELTEVKLRFENSKRFKSEEEVDFMKNI